MTAQGYEESLTAPVSEPGATLLEVKDLTVSFSRHRQITIGVDRVSFRLERSQTLGIVGESGSGKSVLTRAILGLLPATARTTGTATFAGHELTAMSEKMLARIRGQEIGLVLQDPLRSLDPTMRVGKQVAEGLLLHHSLSRAKAREQATELLAEVVLPRPAEAFEAFPHELSGGMRQRAAIAMALACAPKLLILDEPTTALDVSTQAEILALIRRLSAERDLATLFISHDLSLAGSFANEVLVMYGGRVLEQLPGDQLGSGIVPYTRGLLDAAPANSVPFAPLATIPGTPLSRRSDVDGCVFADRCERRMSECGVHRPHASIVMGTSHRYWCFNPHPIEKDVHISQVPAIAPTETSDPLASSPLEGRRTSEILRVEGLSHNYGEGRRVLNDVSLSMVRGRTLAVIGETGSGKTTLARTIIQQPRPSEGTVAFQGNELTRLRGRRLRDAYHGLNMVFQDPFASLDPRWTILGLVREPMHARGIPRAKSLARALELLEFVGLEPDLCRTERPSRLSGGQCQRASIARCLASDPSLIIADEPVSALDVSVQAQVLNLLTKVQREFNLAMLFISHDLTVVRHISHDLIVLYRGEVCESGKTSSVLAAPQHPYTAGLLSSNLKDEDAVEWAHVRPLPEPFTGAAGQPVGCVYAERCPMAKERCSVEPPQPQTIQGHQFACHYPLSADVRSAQK